MKKKKHHSCEEKISEQYSMLKIQCKVLKVFILYLPQICAMIKKISCVWMLFVGRVAGKAVLPKRTNLLKRLVVDLNLTEILFSGF